MTGAVRRWEHDVETEVDMADSGTPEDPISALLRMVTGSGSPDVSAVVPWLRRMMNAAGEGDPWGAASRQQPPPPPPRPPRPAPPRLTPPAGGEDGSRSLYWSLLDLVGDLQRSWDRAGGAPGQADVVDLALKGVMTALTTPAVREQFAPRPLRVVRDEPVAGEFELFRTKSGGYGFRLLDEEGEVLATAKGFDTKQQALDAIAAVRAHASAPVVDTTVDEEPEPIRPVPEGEAAPAQRAAGARRRSAGSPAPGRTTTQPPKQATARTATKATKQATKQATTRAATKPTKQATKQATKAAGRTATSKAAKTARKATKRTAPKPAPEPFESD